MDRMANPSLVSPWVPKAVLAGSAAPVSERYYHPSPFEVAVGYVFGQVRPQRAASGYHDPLSALAEVLLPHLEAGPCYVAFSGGRDSSAVLAMAAMVARKHGLADPVPVTEVYPGIPEVDESDWQQAVIAHLGLTEWLRLEVDGENDLLSPPVKDSLVRRGILWPPATHNKVNLLGRLSKGSLLTGEGGDEVFGGRRATPWAHLRKGTSMRRRRAVLGTAESVLPRPLRSRHAAAQFRAAGVQPWLRPEAARESVRLAARDTVSEPLWWDRALLWSTSRRSTVVSARNYGAVAAEYGVNLVDPLLDLRFISALGSSVGRWGYAGRTAAMWALFGDILPAAVVERRTKAFFNRAFMGEATADFARRWDGSGVDTELVDVERLREEWLSDRPSALSSTLLHSAWSHAEGSEKPVSLPVAAATERP
jgi:Asparagine synthase